MITQSAERGLRREEGGEARQKMLEDVGIVVPKFGAGYLDGNGHEPRCPHLPKRETMILVSGYRTGVRAAIVAPSTVPAARIAIPRSEPKSATKPDQANCSSGTAERDHW